MSNNTEEIKVPVTEEGSEKPKRARKKKVTPEVAPEVVTKATPEVAVETVEAKKEEPKKKVKTEKAPEKSVAEKPKTQRKRKAKVEIDEETRDTRALLKGARSKFTVLKGMLERVDVLEGFSNPEQAVNAIVHYNNFKVMIPAAHMGIEIPEGLSGQEKASIYKKYINTMLGANVEYVVSYVSETDNIAAGNREIAMRIRSKQYFKNIYRNSGKSYMELAMEKKMPIEADVVAVSGSQIRLAIFGAEGKVHAKDAAWRFSNNLSEQFYPGSTVKVIVKEIEYNEKNDKYTVRASIKETTPNLQVKNIGDYSISSTCLGRVSGAIQSGYFICIGDSKTGIEAFCDLVHGGIIPQVGDLVSCQLTNINYETGAAKAKITRIIKRA